MDAEPTGWTGHLMQDICRGLFRWFADKPEARRLVRQRAQEIARERGAAAEPQQEQKG